MSELCSAIHGRASNRLRRVPAFPRNRQADWSPPDTWGIERSSAAHAGALNQFHTEKPSCRFCSSAKLRRRQTPSGNYWWDSDKATLTLGDNRRVDLSQCIIILTRTWEPARWAIWSTVAWGSCISRNWWFDGKIDRTAVEAARRKFTRVHEPIASRGLQELRPEHLGGDPRYRTGHGAATHPDGFSRESFVFNCTPQSKASCCMKAPIQYGARHEARSNVIWYFHCLIWSRPAGEAGRFHSH